MTTRPHHFGSILEQADEHMLTVTVLVLVVGIVAAIATDGSVPALVTKALLSMMVLPTIVLALALTRPSQA